MHGLPPGHPQNPLMGGPPPLGSGIHAHPSGGMVVGGPGGMVLPTALLEQYPALATMDWADGGGGGSGISGAENSSFDASADDWDEEEEDNGGGSGVGSHRSSFDGDRTGWVSDSGGGAHWR